MEKILPSEGIECRLRKVWFGLFLKLFKAAPMEIQVFFTALSCPSPLREMLFAKYQLMPDMSEGSIAKENMECKQFLHFDREAILDANNEDTSHSQTLQ